jgi:hypothetical protein
MDTNSNLHGIAKILSNMILLYESGSQKALYVIEMKILSSLNYAFMLYPLKFLIINYEHLKQRDQFV